MKVTETKLAGVKVIEPKSFGDDRGYFFESWQEARYVKEGMPGRLVQDNVSFSERGVLRGLHFQAPRWQGKLVQVLQGEVFDVAVDMRKDSQTFGQWFGITLSSKNKLQLYVPDGFAHGFQVTSPTAVFHYKCTDYYDPSCEHTILWNDADIGIAWPLPTPSLSQKDACGISFAAYCAR